MTKENRYELSPRNVDYTLHAYFVLVFYATLKKHKLLIVRLGTCLFKVFRKILDNLADLKWKVGCFFREKNRLVIRPWWDIVLVISCVIAVSLDPLFFYIPTINEEEKCLEMDTKLRTVSLVLRSFTDIIFILDILEQISKASTIAEIWWSLATDFLCILPAPQVSKLVLFLRYIHG